MNKEIIKKLSEVIQGLERIEVKGKNNLLNLGDSIAMLEEIRQACITNLTESTDKI